MELVVFLSLRVSDATHLEVQLQLLAHPPQPPTHSPHPHRNLLPPHLHHNRQPYRPSGRLSLLSYLDEDNIETSIVVATATGF